MIYLLFFQSDGKVPKSNDSWNIIATAGASVSAQFFNTTLGMESGPQALAGLILLSNFATPAEVILMLSIGAQLFFSIAGQR